MKRRLSWLLILTLVLTTITACGSNKNKGGSVDSEEVTETISVQVETGWKGYYEEAVARVKEEFPKATINLVEVGSFDHLDILDQTSVTNVDVADVFAIPADRIYGLAQNNALSAIDAKTMADNVGGFKDYDGGLGGNFQVNGEYLAFPMNIETLISFVNTSNAEAKGIDYTKSMEMSELGFEDVLIPLHDAWFGVALTNSANIELLGMDESGKLFSDMTKDFADLEPEKQELITGIYNYWKAHKEAATPLFDKDAASGYMDGAFETGANTSVRIDGPWSTGSLSDLAGDGEDLSILPLGQITMNGNALTHWQSGWGLALNARIEENEDQMILAQKMIEEIVNPEYAEEFFLATGKIMENVTVKEYEKADLPEVDKEVIRAVVESFEKAPARPLFTEWGQVWNTWQNSILSWDSVNPSSPEEAYKEIQASFNAMMSNF